MHPNPAQGVHASVQSGGAQVDAELGSELRASGVTTQPIETVIAVLAAHGEGASINGAAKACRHQL
jgi:hypothetical protein